MRELGIFFSKRSGDSISNNSSKNRDSIFKDIQVDEVVKTLKQDGLFLGINLPRDSLQDILDFSSSASYMGNANPRLCFSLSEKEKEPRSFVSGHHLNPSLLCPAIRKIENDPKLWEIAAQYLETNPVLIESRLKWTFAVGEAVSENMSGLFRFHYDLEDYRFIKFFFYLTDVDELSTPHVCVRGSHNNKKLRHQFSLVRERNDAEIINYYGKENVETVYGKAGSGFVEDFYCFHKGTLPVYKNRLVLEVKFAMNDYGIH